MSENTKIEWTDHTFNLWWGCQKAGPGCDHCYAETLDKRTGGQHWGPVAARRRTGIKNWNDPVRWNKQADAFFALHGRRQRVFCASMADVFDNAVDPQWRVDLFELIRATPNLDWLLLTKRIGNAKAMIDATISAMDIGYAVPFCAWPYPNVWIGATIVNQEEADRDIPKLLQVPAAKRFLSMEPLLGPVELDPLWLRPSPSTAYAAGKVTMDMPSWTRLGCIGLDWVIVGGESGPGARPMHPDWARSLRDQCQARSVPFLFKQWGEHDLSYDRDRDDPDYRRCDKMGKTTGRWINLAGGHGFNGERVHYAHKVGKKAAGRLLDGRTWDGYPV